MKFRNHFFQLKTTKIVIAVLILSGLGVAWTTLLGHKFKSGWCIKDNRDGYIWQVNDFQAGKYHLMGWLDGSWGNAVELEKDNVERKDQGIPVYNQTACPEVIPQ